MKLISCPECENQILERMGTICPKCGHTVGYFNESEEKGSRRYLTFGAGFKLKSMEIDISYLSSTSKIRNPLENTLRFSLSFNFDGANRSAGGQELSLVY